MILFRPTDGEELRLIYQLDMKGFPPRKKEQPIFYPVLNLEYADEIAKRWNVPMPGSAGYVTKFFLDDAYGAKFEHRRVGASHHLELWIPSEELPGFNQHISPPIEVVKAHFSPNFRGYIPNNFGLQGKDATEQLIALARTLNFSAMDFKCEIAANHTAIFLNYAFWMTGSFSSHGLTPIKQKKILTAVLKAWSDSFPEIYLPLTDGI